MFYCAVRTEFLKFNFRRQVKLSVCGKCLPCLHEVPCNGHIYFTGSWADPRRRGDKKKISLFIPKIESGLSSPVAPSLVNTPI